MKLTNCGASPRTCLIQLVWKQTSEIKISLSCSQLDQLPAGSLLQFVIEAMAIEIVDLSIKKDVHSKLLVYQRVYITYISPMSITYLFISSTQLVKLGQPFRGCIKVHHSKSWHFMFFLRIFCPTLSNQWDITWYKPHILYDMFMISVYMGYIMLYMWVIYGLFMALSRLLGCTSRGLRYHVSHVSHIHILNKSGNISMLTYENKIT